MFSIFAHSSCWCITQWWLRKSGHVSSFFHLTHHRCSIGGDWHQLRHRELGFVLLNVRQMSSPWACSFRTTERILVSTHDSNLWVYHILACNINLKCLFLVSMEVTVTPAPKWSYICNWKLIWSGKGLHATVCHLQWLPRWWSRAKLVWTTS